MNLTTNISEAWNAILANKLRAIITSLIIGIGIMALIGILTAIDGLKNSISSNLSSLGSNSFTIEAKGQSGRHMQQGKKEKVYPDVSYRQAREFQKKFKGGGNVSLRVFISSISTVKRGDKKTNPNIQTRGVDQYYIPTENVELEKGRNFTASEIEFGVNSIIIGAEVAKTLFERANPINKQLKLYGQNFKVVGVMAKKGSVMGGSGNDRTLLIPLNKARNLSVRSNYNYEIKVSHTDPDQVIKSIQMAYSTMRIIRKDPLGEEDSFEVKKSDSLLKTIDDTTSSLKMGGFLISLITLLGAAIALMNIMLVSVTERTREIGIRKSLGATPQEIRLQFLVEAIVVCIIGGVMGIIAGLLVGNYVSLFMGSKGFVVPWFWTIMGVVICITVGVLSGIFPAIKASKLDPIASLRYE